MDVICVAMRGRNPDDPNDRTIGAPTEQRLEPKTDGKTNCLTSVAKDNLILQLPHGFNKGGEKAQDGKVPSMTSSSWENNNLLKVKEDAAILTPKRTEYGKEIRKEYESGEIKAQRKEITSLEPREDGKSNALTTVQKDNLLAEMTKANTLTPDAYLATGKRKRDENGKSMLTSMHERRLRRLTTIECSRLQTVPEWYDWTPSSDTQIYRMLGNGWTVEVIKHIFSFIKNS
jgi:site-specific DNA-cytosine methylase